MRISDWSSDVCSSDLCPAWLRHPAMRHPCRSVLIRGQRRIPPGARQRPPWSWSGGWAGFDRVEQHPGDVEPELRIQLADARRAGDVDLGEVVADHVQGGEAHPAVAQPRADLGGAPTGALAQERKSTRPDPR